MKSIWIAAIAAGLCLASLATGNAQTTVDINGQNSWSDASGGSTPTLVTSATNHTSTPPPAGFQSGALVMDAVDGDPLREPQVSLPSITGTTQITTLSMWQYIPSTVTTAYGFYDTIGGNGLIFETGYIAPTGGRWTQQNTWGPATGAPPLNTYGSNPQITIVPDQWQQIQYVFDPNNGISEYYGLPGNMTLAASISVADINSATAFLNSEGATIPAWPYPINGFGWYLQSGALDPSTHPISGPIYWDDMQLTVGNTVVWSDNFDHYVPVGGSPLNPFNWTSGANVGTTNWSTSSNWDVGVPNSAQAAVTVGNLGTTGTLDLLDSSGTGGQDETIGQLTFNGLVPTTIQSSGAPTPGKLVLGASGSTVPILVNSSGTAHTDVISAPMTLSGSASITVLSGSDQLTLSGPIGGGGALILSGSNLGDVVLSGSNNYSGGTVVDSGTLIVRGPASLADGSNLTVGAGAESIFLSPVANEAIANQGAAVAVPEPGTLMLFIAALAGMTHMLWEGADRFARARVQ